MNDRDMMESALAQARRGLDEGVMPIGATLALDGVIVAEAYWRGISRGLLDHPEHVVLMHADASLRFEARREATLYTILEPCLMCMGTAMSFFLGRIVYAMAAPADGATNVAELWRPALGHPTSGGPYSLPLIVGEVGDAEARALVVAWLESGATGAEADFARRTLR